MSGQAPGGPGTPGPGSTGNGPPSAGMSLPPSQHPPPVTGAAGSSASGPGTGPAGNIPQQNLNSIVIEYLSKKGYSRTEAMLRMESAATGADGRPLYQKSNDQGVEKYFKAFDLTRTWIDGSLEIYKPELKRLLWPIFLYSFLSLAKDGYASDSDKFFETYKEPFVHEHEDDVRKLSAVRLPEHVQDSEIAQVHLKSKYRIPLTSVAYFNLIQFLESKAKEGGSVVIRILSEHCTVRTVERGTADPHSLAALLNKANMESDMPAEDEGIPGHNPGSANTNENAPMVLPKLKTGALPMEPELQGDVQSELEDEDKKAPPPQGKNSLVDEFQQMIKEEDDIEAPTRSEVPLPPSLARDVALEVQKVKEHRDRFKIEAKTGGVGPGLSVCMFTFHNTHDSICSMDFSQDNLLVAAGMEESYIRVWSLDGNPLESIIPRRPNDPPPSSSRRLVGHSAAVYAVSFSPCIERGKNVDSSTPATTPRYLVSASGDKSVRLWSVDAWACLVVYKGHDHPVWDVTWGPFGHYFLTGSHDKTARLWSTDHIAGLRIFAGHDQDVDTVCFHPNSAYAFTGSCDKTVRMWSINTGNPVRLFTGHTGNLTAIACSHDGRTLASADDAGAIILWDLQSGRRVKRMRGHAKGGIWSLSWCVESTVLVSGGMDGTVRVWDVLGAGEAQGGQGKVISEGGAGTKIDGHNGAANAPSSSTATAGPSAAGTTAAGTTTGAGGKKRGKDVVVTPDQISAFPTKKSPVYKVKVTRQNLVLAGGAYMP